MNEITITVGKDDLITKLKTNREAHRHLYEVAWDGYCKLTRKDLEDKLERIKAGKPIDPMLGHQPPQDHTADYDDVIDMLTMSLDGEIELTQRQFKQYVKDDWGWRAAWIESTSAYMET